MVKSIRFNGKRNLLRFLNGIIITMQRFFVRHKLSEGDYTHLSDSDSELVINNLGLEIEDPVEIETYENIFLGRITEIEPASVEVEIVEILTIKDTTEDIDITVIQSLSNETKFNYFLEKSVEIGVDRVIPIESKYSLRNRNKALKDLGLWRKIVKDAQEQSRNIKSTIIEKPIRINDLSKSKYEKDSIKICLSTENTNSKYLEEYLTTKDISQPFVIAIGPEKGWSTSDIKEFENMSFDFVKLKGNILRTETAGLVVSSIIKYLKGDI